MLKYKIEPIITISHYELPLHLVEQYGGWIDRKLVKFYENYAKCLFLRYKGKVRYWITFNEINSIVRHPFTSIGVVEENNKHLKQDEFLAAHHQFIASALAIKIGHEIDCNNQIGCMISYQMPIPASCDPDDIQRATDFQRETLFFSDVQVRGYYPSYTAKWFDSLGIVLDVSEEDEYLF